MMDVELDHWLDIAYADYLSTYIAQGGASVKFLAVPDPVSAQRVSQSVRDMAASNGYFTTHIDASQVRVNHIEHLFFSVARSVDWQAHMENIISQTLVELQYSPPDTTRATYHSIAAATGIEQTLVSRTIASSLTSSVFRDYSLSRDFRQAMLGLAIAHLEHADVTASSYDTLLSWLHGDLVTIRSLRRWSIFQKIGRANGRVVLVSLSSWLRKVGHTGLVVTIDLHGLLQTRKTADSLSYTLASALDTYEMLRQFVDATDSFHGTMIVVVLPTALIDVPKRGLNSYDPLKSRIANEVHDQHRANPLAALVRISESHVAHAH